VLLRPCKRTGWPFFQGVGSHKQQGGVQPPPRRSPFRLPDGEGGLNRHCRSCKRLGGETRQDRRKPRRQRRVRPAVSTARIAAEELQAAAPLWGFRRGSNRISVVPSWASSSAWIPDCPERSATSLWWDHIAAFAMLRSSLALRKLPEAPSCSAHPRVRGWHGAKRSGAEPRTEARFCRRRGEPPSRRPERA